MAVFRGFQELRTLRSRAFFVDNGSRERDALAAFRLTAERAIGLAGGSRSGTRGIANLAFADMVADADDHSGSLSLEPQLALLRTGRKQFCGWFALGMIGSSHWLNLCARQRTP